MNKFEERLERLKSLPKYQFSSDLKPERIRVKLDANENWHIAEDTLRLLTTEAIMQVDTRKYPLEILVEFREALAKHLRLPAESIIPTQGSDQGIDLLCEVFLRQDDRALVIGPTFSFYALRTAIADAQCIEVSMNNDLSLPVDNIMSQSKDAAILFVCSPNNPTGNQFTARDIMRVCDNFPGLIVLDEAYVDFAQESLAREVTRHKNLVVLRTFSKAFGLANLRLGFILANPEWAPLFLDSVQYPYPINSIAATMAMKLLQENLKLVTDGIASMRNERAWLLEELRKIKGVKALDSQANFVLVSLPIDVSKAHNRLLENGIATKKIGQVLDIPNCIRVTVGTREMNSIFLQSLNKVLSYV